MLAFKYIAFHYLKYFFVILVALVLFLVGFDYMENAEQLSQSANLTLIYLVYKAFYAIDLLLPLSLLFAMIATKIYLIRSNALVSFFSLGYSRIDVLRPFLFVSLGVTILFVSFHSLSSFSRADEFSRNIRKHSQYLSPTRDLFFTYKDKYVYFSKMLPLQEKAEDIRIFSVVNNSLKEVVVASSAIYRDDFWLIEAADIIKKPEDMNFTSLGITVSENNDLKMLGGFRPKILDRVYEGKVNFTIQDAFDAMTLLEDQKIDTRSIKGALYKIFIYPFFVPCLVVIIFFFVPISVRFLNVSLFSFSAILATLMVWGILYTLIELSNNKTISGEAGIVAPVVILFFIAARQIIHYRTHLKPTRI
ncbi:MAG: LptF/LptG family permease [Sulfurimonas sp.]|jgi:lipopolysaccharide export system permease protein|nr:LptF/LptG family permease [Sulfurimonas sp.]MBU3939720.1 LptF/LptG family permease [bacterium]MBU4023572.1 LptF/LptG family permease [bacterium]MBU4059353.1 LptF/LptG family permease [bacterium]